MTIELGGRIGAALSLPSRRGDIRWLDASWPAMAGGPAFADKCVVKQCSLNARCRGETPWTVNDTFLLAVDFDGKLAIRWSHGRGHVF